MNVQVKNRINELKDEAAQVWKAHKEDISKNGKRNNITDTIWIKWLTENVYDNPTGFEDYNDVLTVCTRIIRITTNNTEKGTLEYYEKECFTAFDSHNGALEVSLILKEAYKELSKSDFSKLFIEWCVFAEGIDTKTQKKYLNYLHTNVLSVDIELPEQVTIYRAMDKREDDSRNYGIFWTLSKEVAEKFKDTYRVHTVKDGYKIGGRMIVERTVSKEDIIHYNNDRKEEEVLVVI